LIFCQIYVGDGLKLLFDTKSNIVICYLDAKYCYQCCYIKPNFSKETRFYSNYTSSFKSTVLFSTQKYILFAV